MVDGQLSFDLMMKICKSYCFGDKDDDDYEPKALSQTYPRRMMDDETKDEFKERVLQSYSEPLKRRIENFTKVVKPRFTGESGIGSGLLDTYCQMFRDYIFPDFFDGQTRCV